MKEGEEEGGKDYFGRENDNDKQDKSEGEQLVTRQVKKRKVALFLAYNGRDYQGMQRNPGAKTIEEILEKALVDAGGVSDSNAGTFVKIGWSRSARTDKGVSALCQVVSLKLLMHNEDVDNVMRTEQSEKGETVENDKANTNLSKEDKKNISIVGKINSILPDDIRILGLKRVAGGFCARNECDRRVYEYVIPTFVLDPVLCREKQYYIKNKLIDPHNHDSAAEVNKEFTEAKLTKFDESQRARLNLILSNFIGTHAFHNFTVGMVPGDPKANRYILEFSADKEVFTIGGIEFLTIRVKGQSFILHQIRKMIGMTLAVMRGVATTDQLQKAFRKDIVMGIPMAPEVGLFLVSCLFDCYNKKFYERMKSHDRLDSDDFLVAVSHMMICLFFNIFSLELLRVRNFQAYLQQIDVHAKY